MAVIIRLQNLPWSANAVDIRRFFAGLSIPEGGVHIVGGEQGDAFIGFSSDEDARLAMRLDSQQIKGVAVRLFLSSKTEMQNVISAAREITANKAPPRSVPSISMQGGPPHSVLDNSAYQSSMMSRGGVQSDYNSPNIYNPSRQNAQFNAQTHQIANYIERSASDYTYGNQSQNFISDIREQQNSSVITQKQASVYQNPMHDSSQSQASDIPSSQSKAYMNSNQQPQACTNQQGSTYYQKSPSSFDYRPSGPESSVAPYSDLPQPSTRTQPYPVNSRSSAPQASFPPASTDPASSFSEDRIQSANQAYDSLSDRHPQRTSFENPVEGHLESFNRPPPMKGQGDVEERLMTNYPKTNRPEHPGGFQEPRWNAGRYEGRQDDYNYSNTETGLPSKEPYCNGPKGYPSEEESFGQPPPRPHPHLSVERGQHGINSLRERQIHPEEGFEFPQSIRSREAESQGHDYKEHHEASNWNRRGWDCNESSFDVDQYDYPSSRSNMQNDNMYESRAEQPHLPSGNDYQDERWRGKEDCGGPNDKIDFSQLPPWLQNKSSGGPPGPQDAHGPAGPIRLHGPSGPPGPHGRPGPHGWHDSQGSRGPPGPHGWHDSQGSRGPPGPHGWHDSQGPRGPHGPPGPSDWHESQGPRGPPGPHAWHDSQRPRGPPGTSGPHGWHDSHGPPRPNDWHDSQGSSGPHGWHDSQVPPNWHNSSGSYGPPGPRGPHGPRGGPPGAYGPPRPHGSNGPPGSHRPPGPPVSYGSSGPRGPPGRYGPQGPGPFGALDSHGPRPRLSGPHGPPGPQGPAGQKSPRGPHGSSGPQGPLESCGPGLNESARPQGPSGPQAPSGSQAASVPFGSGSHDPPGSNEPNRLQGSGPPESTGPQGPSGSQGSFGPSESHGPLGSNEPTRPQGPGPQDHSGSQGSFGPPGSHGPLGSNEPTLPQGPSGPQGPQGSFGPGSSEPTRPQGPSGPQPHSGSQGPPGSFGPPGSSEPTRSQGPSGPQAHSGSQGPPGSFGPPGPRGPGSSEPTRPQGHSGPQNSIGTQGSSISHGPIGPSRSGPTEPLRPQGPPVSQVPHGSKGHPSSHGLSGPNESSRPQGPLLPQGPPGSQGPRSHGPTGPNEPPGPSRPPGLNASPRHQGPPRPQGPTGSHGPPGPSEPIRPVGPPGRNDPRRLQGPQGPPGTNGPQGPIGRGEEDRWQRDARGPLQVQDEPLQSGQGNMRRRSANMRPTALLETPPAFGRDQSTHRIEMVHGVQDRPVTGDCDMRPTESSGRHPEEPLNKRSRFEDVGPRGVAEEPRPWGGFQDRMPPQSRSLYVRLHNCESSWSPRVFLNIFSNVRIGKPNGIRFEVDKLNRRTGYVFVKLWSLDQYDSIMRYNGMPVHDKEAVLRVEPCSVEEFYSVHELSDPRPQSIKELPVPVYYRDMCVEITGLPSFYKKHDIIKLFSDADLNLTDVNVEGEKEGKCLGRAFIICRRKEDFQMILSKNGRLIYQEPFRIVAISYCQLCTLWKDKYKNEAREREPMRREEFREQGCRERARGRSPERSGRDKARGRESDRRERDRSDDYRSKRREERKSDEHKKDAESSRKAYKDDKTADTKSSHASHTRSASHDSKKDIFEKSHSDNDHSRDSCKKTYNFRLVNLPKCTTSDIAAFLGRDKLDTKGIYLFINEGYAIVDGVDEKVSSVISQKNGVKFLANFIRAQQIDSSELKSKMQEHHKKYPEFYSQFESHKTDSPGCVKSENVSGNEEDASKEDETSAKNQDNSSQVYLTVSNLPVNATISKIEEFFQGYKFIPGSITLRLSAQGKPLGEAVIAFSSAVEVDRVIRNTDGKKMGGRYITTRFGKS